MAIPASTTSSKREATTVAAGPPRAISWARFGPLTAIFELRQKSFSVMLPRFAASAAGFGQERKPVAAQAIAVVIKEVHVLRPDRAVSHPGHRRVVKEPQLPDPVIHPGAQVPRA